VKRYWGIFVFVAFLFSCKKDTPIPSSSSEDTCTLSGAPATGWVIESRNSVLNLYNGFSDPLGSNYLYYLFDRYQTQSTNGSWGILCKVDLVTGTKIKLDSSVIGIPQINQHGWITYYKLDQNIYKIKTNGDSLTKLTNDNNNMQPYWNYSGNYIYFAKSSGSIETIVMNENGITIDTVKNVNGLLNHSKISNKAILTKFSNNQAQLFLHDLSNSSDKLLCSLTNNNFQSPVFDNTDAYIYWTDNDGLKRVNVSTLAVDLLFKKCQRQEFYNFTLAFNANTFVATKTTRNAKSSSTLYVQTDLYKLNLDGSNPQIINVP
jgi:hypothetical protein